MFWESVMAEPSLLTDAKYWRSRGEEMRSLAGGVVDLDTKERLLRIADEYDHLAVRAQERASKR